MKAKYISNGLIQVADKKVEDATVLGVGLKNSEGVLDTQSLIMIQDTVQELKGITEMVLDIATTIAGIDPSACPTCQLNMAKPIAFLTALKNRFE